MSPFGAERRQGLANLASAVQRRGKIQIAITCGQQTRISRATQLHAGVAVGVYTSPAGHDDKTVPLLPDIFEILLSGLTGGP